MSMSASPPRPFESWKDRAVLITGHTGFKGSWLALWLRQLGAQVHGYALDPPTEPSLYAVARIGSLLASDTRADLREQSQLQATFDKCRPEVVFHLAAQSLVREGYRDPLGTMATNVLGTAAVLECARRCPSVLALVVITTDKVYENRESLHAYREGDRLGGLDPYSGSKAAAELVTATYRSSYFAAEGTQVATARAGNVIGGGDWAVDRLVPDCLRAFASGNAVQLRYPNALRPWQHVLEPLAGYLHLASHLLGQGGVRFARAWNFGPGSDADATVATVAGIVARLWGSGARVEAQADGDHPHEAGLLRLDSEAARTVLGWAPRWSLEQALSHTVRWQRAWLAGEDMQALSLQQIAIYQQAAGT
jgi:CDP-glucose 4,6-dehydratase